MIIYTADAGKYSPVSGTPKKIYINLTNQCNNDCVFCLRDKKNLTAENNLWLDIEPTADEIISELEKINLQGVEEIIFCGFGEPTMKLAELIEILRHIKKFHSHISTRLNTNGLGNLEHGRDISGDFKNILDTVSISLNCATAERYFKITRSKFGLQAYEAMLNFAENMKLICKVVMTVVDKVTPPDEIEMCKKICAEHGLTLRIRPYEDS